MKSTGLCIGRAGVFSTNGTQWDCGRCNIALTWSLLLQSRDINPPQGGCSAESTHEQKMLRDHWKLKTASALSATTSGLLKAQVKEGSLHLGPTAAVHSFLWSSRHRHQRANTKKCCWTHAFYKVSMTCKVSAGTTDFHVFWDLMNLYSFLPWNKNTHTQKKVPQTGASFKEILN